MRSFKCPYCSEVFALSQETYTCYYLTPHNTWSVMPPDHSDCVRIDFYKCPSCQKPILYAKGVGESTAALNSQILPISSAIQFPEYIPQQIRQDYEESCAIVSLSPKASATLSRRCLQGMIRDFWNVKSTSLFKEIEALQNNIPVAQWNVLNGIRRIGNIGAHMEKDVNLIVDIEPEEAQKLIKLIEMLMRDWYINRHEQEELYAEICSIDSDLQSKRKQPSQSED